MEGSWWKAIYITVMNYYPYITVTTMLEFSFHPMNFFHLGHLDVNCYPCRSCQLSMESMGITESSNGGTVPCKAIFLLHRPYIGLIYGRYLQFRILKWPLIILGIHRKCPWCSSKSRLYNGF